MTPPACPFSTRSQHQKKIQSYETKLVQFTVAYKKYLDQLKRYKNNEISDYPEYPDYPVLPSLSFNAADELSNQGNPLSYYSSYGRPIPENCGLTENSRVVNVQDIDLEQVGTVFNNMPIYRLKDKANPLVTLAYKNKIDYYNENPDEWDVMNKGIKKPTLEEYVTKNPLLFIRGYWQRWAAMGEFDIKLPGGCGKPVIYLYPTKPTNVSVEFTSPMRLDVSIPTYSNGWRVRADSNGRLTDLVPQLTDCQKINTSRPGSEYAGEACKNNTYPYLYWAGQALAHRYPEISEGWVVEKRNLSAFLNGKLDEAGLSKQENDDMLSYWLPKMLAKDAPYYKISFLRTAEMNKLVPMKITPEPDTVYRIFLDYEPLSSKPTLGLIPQKLEKLHREGFTVVEWGGHIK